MEFDDQEPSQLWRKMRNLMRVNIKDEAFKFMWLRHLPSCTISVLAVTEEFSMDRVSEFADKIFGSTTISELSTINKEESNVKDRATK